jgi:hypothetical protein
MKHDRYHSTIESSDDVILARILQKYDFLERRSKVAEKLLQHDPYSIDAIALMMIVFSAMASAKFAKGKAEGRDRRRFRALLTTYCPSLVNRMSMPEFFLASRQRHPMKAIEWNIAPHFPVRLDYTPDKDPTLDEFKTWLQNNPIDAPEDLLEFDYIGCIFMKYRNAVVHTLRVADGREANYFEGEHSNLPIFYSRHTKPYGALIYTPDQYADAVLEMRFGVLPMYLHSILLETISNLRKWATETRNDIFATADEVEHYEWVNGAMPKRRR